MPLDLSQARANLEAQLTDTVRISRTAGQPVLDPVTGEPGQTPTTVVYDGPGAVLSTHGQIVLGQVLGQDWLSEGSAWYRLVTPVSAPVALLGDLVEVVTETGGLAGRICRRRRHRGVHGGDLPLHQADGTHHHGVQRHLTHGLLAASRTPARGRSAVVLPHRK
ncbi:DUF6093 family protein [Streptomyces sp. NPDC057460]|uniref:DUF6093 family protein n=1 Tax=Streptomyces sp. NPDC057460 TaxID=3346141 RepID=UPI003698A962